jgi:cyclophilin family peptidyl-prolyl cis-trans isomerase
MRHLFFLVTAMISLAFVACAEDRSGVSSERKSDQKLAEGKYPIVEMETSMGTIKIELDDAHSPDTVKNFLQYVDDKFYDGTIFHRVMSNFMIQGGGFEPGLKDAKSEREIRAKEKKTRDPIKNEGRNGLSNVRGAIAMARTNRLDSATAQFFINVKDNPGLDNPVSPYCVFGKVIEGMDVVDKIRNVKTTAVFINGRPAMENVPEEDVSIKSVRRVKQDDKDEKKAEKEKK